MTEADVKAIVEEAKSYARSKGFVIDSSMTEVGTSWGPELGITKEFEPGDNKLYAKQLRDRTDSTYELLREDWSKMSDEEYAEYRAKKPAHINIFYKYRPNDSAEPYYIYVVY